MKNKIIGCILLFFTTIDILVIVLAMNIVPLQLKRETFKYELGDTISTEASDYINANETVIEKAKLNVSQVKNEVGVFPASITYMDKKYEFHIKIEDTTNPVVTLKQVQFNIGIGDTIEALDLLESIEDSSEVVAYFEEEEGQRYTEKKYNQKGSYVENIVVVDSAGNQSGKVRVKIVVGIKGNIPTIYGVDEIEVQKGKKFNPLDGVTAKDGQGNDITSSVQILQNTVNVKEVGIYEVIYVAVDSNGYKIQRSRKVIVVE